MQYATYNFFRVARTRLWTVEEKCVQDFVAAWTRVMNLDRFDSI
jgi:hypothetical protein